MRARKIKCGWEFRREKKEEVVETGEW